jgi:hypothetical protein
MIHISADKFYGRKIKSVAMVDDKFIISFAGGSEITITDDGQSCCESRYMTCDDNPADLVGGKLHSIEVKKVEDVDAASIDEEHQIAFLEVATDKTSITFCTHVEHNGYYGEFGLNVSQTKESR